MESDSCHGRCIFEKPLMKWAKLVRECPECKKVRDADHSGDLSYFSNRVVCNRHEASEPIQRCGCHISVDIGVNWRAQFKAPLAVYTFSRDVF